MRDFVLSMIVVFLVLCVPWFCVAQAGDDYEDDIMERERKNKVRQACLPFSDTEAEYDRCMYVKGGLFDSECKQADIDSGMCDADSKDE